jgi:hypothetical protein
LAVDPFGADQAGEERIDLVAPDQPLSGDLIEAGAHAIELEFAHGLQNILAFHQATLRMLS